MTVFINDKEYELEPAATVTDALKAAGIPERGIATALNGHVVKADTRQRTVLAQGDRLLIIKAFYGG